MDGLWQLGIRTLLNSCWIARHGKVWEDLIMDLCNYTGFAWKRKEDYSLVDVVFTSLPHRALCPRSCGDIGSIYQIRAFKMPQPAVHQPLRTREPQTNSTTHLNRKPPFKLTSPTSLLFSYLAYALASSECKSFRLQSQSSNNTHPKSLTPLS